MQLAVLVLPFKDFVFVSLIFGVYESPQAMSFALLLLPIVESPEIFLFFVDQVITHVYRAVIVNLAEVKRTKLLPSF